MADAVARAWLTGTPEEPIINLDLPAGPKGEPGGWNMGTNLGNTDLNTVTTPGLYYQPSTASPLDPTKNYPPMVDVNGSVRGVLEVLSWGGGATTILQRYTRVGNLTGIHRARTVYVRAWHNTVDHTWSEWTVLAASSSVADSVGFRTQQMWDDAVNSWADIAGPGGWTQGSELGTNDLNAITTPGLYRQTSSPTITLARNYPEVGRVGTLSVEARIPSGTSYGPSVVQTFTPFFGVPAAEARMFFKRVLTGSVWQPWRVFSSQRVDNTAGRAVYTWDDTSSREQMIYGDTGWRNVTDDAAFALQNGWKAQSVHVRRVGSTVHLMFRVLDGTAATGNIIVTPPAGFRLTSGIPAYISHPVIITDTTIRNIAVQGISGTMQSLTGWTTGDRIVPVISTTTDPWPTALPGTAVGTIPNN